MVRVVPGVGRIELDGDGVIVIVHERDADLGAEGIAPLLKLHIELANGRKTPVLVDIRGVKRIDRAGRELAAGPEVAAVTSRLALVVGSKVTAMIGSFFLRVSQPAYPTRMFTEIEPAQAWLLERDKR